jgi:4-amino-4-deoxy-L-arabinose transferase-like glycosyltransferase
MAQSEAAGPAGRRFRRWLMAVVIVATVVRGGVLYVSAGKLNDDPDGYRRLARNVVDKGTYGWHLSADGVVQPSAYRPPLYTLLVAACIAWPGGDPILVAWLHLAAGVATVALVFLLAQRLGLARAGPVAALLIACDPILLNQSTLVMTETLATLLAVLAWMLLARAGPCWSIGRVSWAGAGLALAALCRPTFLVVLVAVAITLGLVVPKGRRCTAVLAFAVAALLVLAPWIVRNQAQFGRPIVATTHGGYTLWLGNNRSFYDYLREAPWGAVWRGAETLGERDGEQVPAAVAAFDWPDRELALDRWHYAKALRTIRVEPATFGWSCLVRLGRLWQPMPHAVDLPEAPRRRWARRAVGVWYILEYSLAAIGLWGLGRRLIRPLWLWGTLLCGGFSLVHLFYWSNMRMRSPLLPVVALLASLGIVRLVDRWKHRKFF